MLHEWAPIHYTSTVKDHNFVDKVQYLLNEDHANVNIRNKLVRNGHKFS
jgi:hypothetical protein